MAQQFPYTRQLGGNPNNFKLDRPTIGGQGQFDKTLGQADYASLMGGQNQMPPEQMPPPQGTQQGAVPPQAAQRPGYHAGVGMPNLMELLKFNQQKPKGAGQRLLEGMESSMNPYGYAQRMQQETAQMNNQARLIQEYLEQSGLTGRAELLDKGRTKRATLDRESKEKIAKGRWTNTDAKTFQRILADPLTSEMDKDAVREVLKARSEMNEIIDMLKLEYMQRKEARAEMAAEQKTRDAELKEEKHLIAKSGEERDKTKFDVGQEGTRKKVIDDFLEDFKKPDGTYNMPPEKAVGELNKQLNKLGYDEVDLEKPSVWDAFMGKGTYPTRVEGTTATTTISSEGGLGGLYEKYKHPEQVRAALKKGSLTEENAKDILKHNWPGGHKDYKW